jgi:hypothetical protein
MSLLTVEQKIAKALLANNCNLLAVICQASFVGDTAAVVAKGILALLRNHKRGNITERFLKRLLRVKVNMYCKYIQRLCVL